MDLFGFRVPDNREEENKKLIKEAVNQYRKNIMTLLVIFGLIIILLNVLIVPYLFNERLESRLSEINLMIERERHLPDNYSMVGVEVGINTINSVVEITCSSTKQQSRGTGFIINSAGYIITNAHVITYKDNLTNKVYPSRIANFYNGSVNYSLDVIDYDLQLDLAILKMRTPPSTLESVIFGNSDYLNMGEEVVAIGNAQGLGLALTLGVVSDPLKTFRDGTKAIQMDAAINPGNSGGPLFNVYSELVGVITFKIIDTEANEGMGFAIPSNITIDYINTVRAKKGITIYYTISDNYSLS